MRAAIVDLDGTIYRSTDPVAGAVEGIRRLRSAGLEVIFVSNTSTKSRTTCRDRLVDIGIDVGLEDVLTSTSITATHVAESHPGTDVIAIGEDALADELEHAGVELTDNPEAADVLVVGKDRSFDFETLTTAVRAIDSGARFVVTNRDRRTPSADGIVPGTGALVAAIAAAAGRDPDVVTGKPNDPTVEAVLDRLDLPASDCFVIGDNIETDVAIGEHAGMTTVLIESGLHTGDVTRDLCPDYVLGSLASIDEVLAAEGAV